MKLTGNFKDIYYTDKDVVIAFSVPKKFYPRLKKIPTDKLLTIDINERLSQRSQRQNRALWALLEEISIAENGRKDKTLVEDLYKQLLTEARIKVFYMKVDKEALPILKSTWRVVEILEEQEIKGTTYIGCNLYKGSSNFNTQEMNDLIEVVLDRGAKYDINILYFEEELNA